MGQMHKLLNFASETMKNTAPTVKGLSAANRLRTVTTFAIGLALPLIIIGCQRNESMDPTANQGEARPSAELAPDDVVAIQIESLRSGDPASLETAFRFTSPKNQIFTGPSARFAKIMSEAPYSAIRDAERVDFFDVEIQDSRAKQIVQCVDKDGAATLYLFELTRQGAGELAGCWLTESVTCSRVQFQIEGEEAVVR